MVAVEAGADAGTDADRKTGSDDGANLAISVPELHESAEDEDVRVASEMGSETEGSDVNEAVKAAVLRCLCARELCLREGAPFVRLT